MSPSYTPLNGGESDLENDDGVLQAKKNKGCTRPWAIFISLSLLVTNLTTLCHFTSQRKAEAIWEAPLDYANVDSISLDTTWKHFWWNTAYSLKNHSDSDALWNAIKPSHGFVAMDRQWAAQQHWPESMRLPSDSSKGVYLLEAYHQLHCLRIIRNTFWEAVEGRPFTYHLLAHMDHCFDSLRQSVQCSADTTPLYTFGDFTAGDGQLHRCRNWNQLRDFATEHTACYKDTVEDVLLKEHFGVCDDGSDGLA